MSGLAGIFHKDGSPVPSEHLQAMLDAMSDWGPDGRGQWVRGPVALGQVTRWNTPESQGETLPLADESGRTVLIASARLDNREALCPALDVPHHERRTISDSALLLRAYEKWGEDCPVHLLGDWSFALWDASLRRLLLARDPCGANGLFWHDTPARFAFASSLKGLLALPGVPHEPNLRRVVDFLIRQMGEQEETYYKAIYRLPTAHQISIGEGAATPQRYWNLADAPDVRFSSDEAYVDAFRELFMEAVRCRLRSVGGIAATLSGGLDSGGVCAVAAMELAKTGGGLFALTSVPRAPEANQIGKGHEFTDETFYATEVARLYPNVAHCLDRSESISPLEGIRRTLNALDEPFTSASNRYWMVSVLDNARRRECGTLLTGQGGNYALSYVGAEEYRRGLPYLFKQAVLKPVFGPLRDRIRRTGGPAGERLMYSPISTSCADDYRVRQLIRENDRHFKPSYRLNGREHHFQVMRAVGLSFNEGWSSMARERGIEVRDPTWDRRILEFCLGIPDEQYRLEGQKRRLARRALKGWLPDVVLDNPRRGRQAADVGWRILSEKEEIVGLLRQLESSPEISYLLDLPRMERSLKWLEREETLDSTVEASLVLLRGLLVGLFLARFE